MIMCYYKIESYFIFNSELFSYIITCQHSYLCLYVSESNIINKKIDLEMEKKKGKRF